MHKPFSNPLNNRYLVISCAAILLIVQLVAVMHYHHKESADETRLCQLCMVQAGGSTGLLPTAIKVMQPAYVLVAVSVETIALYISLQTPPLSARDPPFNLT